MTTVTTAPPAPVHDPADPLLTEMRQSGLLLCLLFGVLAVALAGGRLLAVLT